MTVIPTEMAVRLSATPASQTTFGRIGVKVWIYKGDVTQRELAREQVAAPRAPRRGDGPGGRPQRPQRRPRSDNAPQQQAPAAEAPATATADAAPAAEAPAGTEA